MKVILSESLESLGPVGSVVEVKPGYARNFLIPRGLAMLATDGNVREVERRRAGEIEKEKKVRLEGEERARKIQALTCVIEARSGEDGKLFGSITAAQVHEALQKQGVAVDKKDVLLKDPIRKLGTFQADIRCYIHLKASLKVQVVKAKE